MSQDWGEWQVTHLSKNGFNTSPKVGAAVLACCSLMFLSKAPFLWSLHCVPSPLLSSLMVQHSYTSSSHHLFIQVSRTEMSTAFLVRTLPVHLPIPLLLTCPWPKYRPCTAAKETEKCDLFPASMKSARTGKKTNWQSLYTAFE